jgi:hypothetical protein
MPPIPHILEITEAGLVLWQGSPKGLVKYAGNGTWEAQRTLYAEGSDKYAAFETGWFEGLNAALDWLGCGGSSQPLARPEDAEWLSCAFNRE